MFFIHKTQKWFFDAERGNAGREYNGPLNVLAGLDPAIHEFADEPEDVDPRVKPRGDGGYGVQKGARFRIFYASITLATQSTRRVEKP